MRRSRIVGAVAGLLVLAGAPAALAAATPAAGAGQEVEVRAAADIFLDLGPVKGETRNAP